MTDIEYQEALADIEARLGKAEWDEVAYPKEPANEAAKQIQALNKRKRSEASQAKKQAAKDAGQSQAPETLTDFVKAVPSESLRRAMNRALPPIFIEEHDLKAFTDLERLIIQGHYEDRSLNQEQLAKRYNVSRQSITALLNSREFKLLQLKYFEKEAPEATRLALLHLLHDNDQKTAHRLAEHYGIIKAEKMDLNVTSKPIDDPEAIKVLKEMSRKLKESEERQ